MKTLTNFNNLKKLGAGIIASLILTTSGIRASEGDASAVMERLENFVEMSEAALKYEAPEITEPASLEMEWLDSFIAASEASLKYEAPADENLEIASELERLDMLVASTEASLKYRAPVEDDATWDNVTALDNLLAETK
jgi:hypothetical protein